MLVYWYLSSLTITPPIQCFKCTNLNLNHRFSEITSPTWFLYSSIWFHLICSCNRDQLLYLKDQSDCISITTVYFTSMHLISIVTHIPEGILCLCSRTVIVSAGREKKKGTIVSNETQAACTEIMMLCIIRAQVQGEGNCNPSFTASRGLQYKKNPMHWGSSWTLFT